MAIETNFVEYKAYFTIDEKSAKQVDKSVKSQLNSMASQDSRLTSIARKMKEIAGPEGAAAYSREMEKVTASMKKLQGAYNSAKKTTEGTIDGRSKGKTVEAYKEVIVAQEKLNQLQNQLATGASRNLSITKQENAAKVQQLNTILASAKATERLRNAELKSSQGTNKADETSRELSRTKELAALKNQIFARDKQLIVTRDALKKELDGQEAARIAKMSSLKNQIFARDKQSLVTRDSLKKELDNQDIARTSKMAALKNQIFARDKQLIVTREALKKELDGQEAARVKILSSLKDRMIARDKQGNTAGAALKKELDNQEIARSKKLLSLKEQILARDKATKSIVSPAQKGTTVPMSREMTEELQVAKELDKEKKKMTLYNDRNKKPKKVKDDKVKEVK